MWDALKLILFVAIILGTGAVAAMGDLFTTVGTGLMFALGISALIDHARNAANEEGFYLAA